MSSLEHLTLGPQEPTITSEMETTQGHQADEMQKLAEYLRTLREERGKVEAFKRELPLCMQLIDEAIATAKQRAMEDQCSPTASLQTTILDAEISDSEKSKGPESFMPLKRRWNKQQKDKKGQGEVSQDSEQHHKVVLGRPAWTGKVQQWTQQSDCTAYEKASSSRSTKRHADFGGNEQARSPLTSSRLQLSLDHRQRGAFVPFIRERQLNSPILSQPTEAVPDAAPELRVTPAVRSAGQNVQISRGFDVDVNVQGREYHSSDARMSTDQSGQTRTSVSQQQRKARRCWSPELHRRFVSALQQLGGSQVATPKQIREFMKVDSLTNDEVKSHLQKYRLHTRRPSPSPSSPSPHAPQLVVLGWMRPDQFKAAVGAASQASTGGVCDDPPLVIAQKYIPPQSTEQPQMQPLPVLQKHQPAISTSQTSLRGPSVTGGSPNSSSESYLDEGDDVQERTSMSSGQTERQLEGIANEQLLQSAIESKGSTTSLVDIGIDTTQNRDCNSSHAKLHTSPKTKAAA